MNQSQSYLFTFRHLNDEEYKYIEEAYCHGLCFEFDLTVIGTKSKELINILSNIFAIVSNILIDNNISEKCVIGYEAIITDRQILPKPHLHNYYWLHPIYEFDIGFHVPKSICIPPYVFEYNCLHTEYHWFEKHSQVNIRFISARRYNEANPIPIKGNCSGCSCNINSTTTLYYHKKVFPTPYEKVVFLKDLIRRFNDANDDYALKSLLHYQHRPIMPTEWVEIKATENGVENFHYTIENNKTITIPNVYKVDKKIIEVISYPYVLYFGRYNHILERYDIQVFIDNGYNNYIVYMPAVDDQHAYVTDRRLQKLDVVTKL